MVATHAMRAAAHPLPRIKAEEERIQEAAEYRAKDACAHGKDKRIRHWFVTS
jgi:hypothetical protein